jgi:putative membrane protein
LIARDQNFRESVEQAVERLERDTDAEIVVVAASRSSSYRDIALFVGLFVGALMLAVVLYSPWTFGPATVPLELAVAIAFGTFVAHRWPRLLRLLIPAKRRAAEVHKAAAAAFLDEQVHGTRRRTGVLVYLAALEECAVTVADHGVEARVPPVAWGRLAIDGRTLEGFLQGLEMLGALLAEHVPALADNPNELPNAPRILS